MLSRTKDSIDSNQSTGANGAQKQVLRSNNGLHPALLKRKSTAEACKTANPTESAQLQTKKAMNVRCLAEFAPEFCV
jgi:hypothetical protein